MTDQNEIMQHCYNYFKWAYSANSPDRNPESVTCISQSDNDTLNVVPTELEIHQALLSINQHKAHGPDGFNAKFFQVFWTSVKKDIQSMVLDLFVKGTLETLS